MRNDAGGAEMTLRYGIINQPALIGSVCCYRADGALDLIEANRGTPRAGATHVQSNGDDLVAFSIDGEAECLSHRRPHAVLLVERFAFAINLGTGCFVDQDMHRSRTICFGTILRPRLRWQNVLW